MKAPSMLTLTLASLALSVLTAMAQAAPDVSVPSQILHLTYPSQSELSRPVAVQISVDGTMLNAHFEIKNPKVNAKKVLAPGEYPYQHDVVELFLSVNGPTNLPYYEFELSPFDQSFNVQINDLHKPFINNIDVGSLHHAERVPGGWRGDLAIPLKNLGWNGDLAKITGNAYAITGNSPNRSYWSLSIPQQPRPNFHQPHFFRPLALKAANESAEK